MPMHLFFTNHETENIMTNFKTLLVLVASAAVYAPVYAASHAGAPMTMTEGKTGGGAMGSTAMADGEVRKVDMEAKKITIKHGEIKNLDMPGMTMVFQVKDPAMLDKVKAGDKILFKAEKTGGAIVVTDIVPGK